MQTKSFTVFLALFFAMIGSAYPQQPVKLISPQKNALHHPDSIHFSWDTHLQYDYFQIQVSSDGLFFTTETDSSFIYDSQITLSVSQLSKTYFWRVRAFNGSTFSDWSQVFQFRTFNPLVYNNCMFWLSADTGAVLQAGNKVSLWNDRSPFNRNFYQTNPLRQPILLNDSLNGLPVVSFNSSFLRCDSTFAINHLFFVTNFNGNTTFPNYNTLFTPINYGSSGDIFLRGEPSTNVILPNGYFAGNVFVNGIQTRNFSPLKTFKVLWGHRTTGVNYPGGYVIGNEGTGTSLFWDGCVAEVIAYNTSLTNQQRDSVFTYLADKYSDPLTLGANKYISYGFCPVNISFSGLFSEILWSTGSTNFSANVSQSGLYWVQAKDNFGRLKSDSVYVQFPDFSFPDSTICFGDTVTFSCILQGSYTYEWSDLSTNSFLDISQAGTYWLKVTDTSGCFKTDTFNVSVDNFSQQISLGNDTSLCSGNIIQLVSGQQFVTDYLWLPGNQTTSSLQIDTTGLYILEVRNSLNCTARDSIQVAITGTAPVPDFQYQYLCFGDSTLFEDFSTPQADIFQRTWIVNNTDTLFGQSVKYLFSQTGNQTVTLYVEDSAGCSSELTKTFNILPVPLINISYNPPCINIPVLLKSNPTVPPLINISQREWFIDGLSAGTNENLLWTFPATGDYNVTHTIVADNGCTVSETIILNVSSSYPSASPPDLFYPVHNMILGDTTILFQWFSQTGVTNHKLTIATDQLFANIVHVSTNITGTSQSVTLAGNTTYFWKVEACNPCNVCVSSVIQKFSVFSPASVSGLTFWLSSDNGITKDGSNKISFWKDRSANNYNFQQTNQSLQPVFIADSLNGLPVVSFSSSYLRCDSSFQVNTLFVVSNFNSSSNFPNFNALFTPINYSTSGDIHIRAVPASTEILGNGYFTQNIFINNIQTRNFAPLNKFKIFQGNRNNGIIYNGYVIGTEGLSSLYWNGSVAEIIGFNTVLSQNQTDSIFNYLCDKYASPVNLGPNIYVDYGFCDTTITATGSFNNFLWSTGATGSSIQVNETGTYWVQVIDIFGRLSADTIFVEFPALNLTDTTICLGDTAVYSWNLPGQYSYLWSDSSTQTEFETNQNGVYWLKVTDTLGCFRTDTFIVNIDYFSLQATLGPDLSICSGDSISLVQGANEAISYVWSTAETTSAIIPQNPGQYSVTVSNAIGCSAIDTISVSFQGYKPLVEFLADSVCFGFPTTFTDTSVPVAPDVISGWQWLIDGNIITDQHPQYQFSTTGTHQVQLFVETQSGCNASITQEVFVFPNPDTDFQPVTGCSATPIQFTNLTTLNYGIIQSYEWLIVDSNNVQILTSNLIHPEFTFNESGLYSVYLIAITQSGCRDTIMKTLEIRRSPAVDFSWSNSCIGQTTAFTETTQVPAYEIIISRNWDFGDNSVSSLPNPLHMFTDTGTFQVTLYNKSINGCELSLTKPVVIYSLPVAGFYYSLACANTPVEFFDTSFVPNGSIDHVMWTFPNGDTTSFYQPVYAFPDTGIYNVQLLAVSNVGCSGSVTMPVTVHPIPVASFVFSPEYGIPPLEVSFFNTSSGADEYSWDFDDSSTSDLPNPIHTFTQANVYDVELVAQNTFLCSNSVVGTVYVIPSTFDISVIQAKQTVNGSIMQSSILIKNIGTRIVRTLKMKVQLDQGIPVTELWEGTLYPGEETWFSFHSVFETEQLLNRKIICYSALPNEDAEDVHPENNTICSVLEPGFYIISVTPNPAQNSVVVNFIMNENTVYDFELISADGKIVIQQSDLEGAEGFNTVQVDVSQVRQGMYLLKLVSRNEYRAHKIMIAR